MSISGKMSVGVVTIENTPSSRIVRPMTTNVYGRRSARRTIHMSSRRRTQRRRFAANPSALGRRRKGAPFPPTSGSIGGMDRQSLRHFVAAYEKAYPQEVVRVTDSVSLQYDVMALVLEYERRRRWPILLFESVAGYEVPIIANAVASRRALAFAPD